MSYELRLTKAASKRFSELGRQDPAKHRKVVKCLRKLAEDPRQTGLNSHKYQSMCGPGGEEVWENYVENQVSAAWRVFWFYGPNEQLKSGVQGEAVRIITILAITPHP